MSFEPMNLLQRLGVELELDYDDELIITIPEELDAHGLRSFLSEFERQLTNHLLYRRKRTMMQFVGGPKSGERYGWYEVPGRLKGYNIERAKWAVYEFTRDGRAYFKGFASSERKARQGILIKEHED